MFFDVQHFLDDSPEHARGGGGGARTTKVRRVKQPDAVEEFLSAPSPYRQPPSTAGIFDLPDVAELIAGARKAAEETAPGRRPQTSR